MSIQQEFLKRLKLYAEESGTLYEGIEAVLQSVSDELPITCDILKGWYQVISPEQKNSDPFSCKVLLEKINQNLNKKIITPSQIVCFIADSICEFELLHPFETNNHQMAQLLANYMALHLHIPLIIFRKNERSEYQDAVKNSSRMRIYIAKKLKECIFDEKGQLLFLVEDFGSSARYKSPNHLEQEVVEWHELFDAIAEWDQIT